MKVEVLNTIYKMLKNSTVDSCEIFKHDVSIKMKLLPEALADSPKPEKPALPQNANGQARDIREIKSDNVGVFYTIHPSLKKIPPLRPGATVKKKQVVGTIVSMGISHNLVSQVEGKIITQKVRNKEPVEFGEVIFEVEKE